LINKLQIQELISFIDLTTLSSQDTNENVSSLLNKVIENKHLAMPATICVFPCFASLVNTKTDLNIAVVAGYFPTGQATTAIKLLELEHILNGPAEEVDVVINQGNLIEDNLDAIQVELTSSKNLLKNLLLKVIIESGELNPTQIKTICKVVIQSGADFIKTSTGKTTTGATPEAVKIICEEIKAHFDKTGSKIGIKVSGGIRTLDDASLYYGIVKNILGEEWLTPELFRIGASTLYDHLIEIIKDE
jgi:deoxyribose-phosphate aldolase